MEPSESVFHAIREFEAWYRSEPRLAFNRTAGNVHEKSTFHVHPEGQSWGAWTVA
jgi:hypothetical protein